MNLKRILLVAIYLSIVWDGSTCLGQFVNQSLIYITPSTDLFVNSNLFNESELLNEGSLTLKRDYINTGTYEDLPSALVLLEGDTVQQIKTKDQINKLVVNGLGDKILLSNLDSKGEIKLIVGKIITTDSFYVHVSKDGKIEGGSSGSFVDGKLFLEGFDNKNFPIGKRSVYSPVTITDIRARDSLVLGIEMFPTPGKLKAGLGIDSMSQQRIYKLHVASGKFTDAFITLPVLGDEGLNDIEDAVVGESKDSISVFRSIGNGISRGDASSGLIKSQSPIKAFYFGLGIPVNTEVAGVYYVPSALSPLAPNIEDQVIKVYSRDIISDGFYFRVYDKSGHTIFESFSYNDMSTYGWDGRNLFSGILENADVYHFQIGGEFYNGIKFKKTGIITLVR